MMALFEALILFMVCIALWYVLSLIPFSPHYNYIPQVIVVVFVALLLFAVINGYLPLHGITAR